MALKDALSDERREKDQELAALRAALIRSQRETLKWKARTDHLVQATITAAHDAVLARPLGKIPEPKTKPRHGVEVALWHLSDWQGAKKTPTYNSGVMDKRVHLFVDKAQQITALQRSSVTVDDCVILLGGDMIEGLFNFPTQAFEIDATLFTQFVNVANLLTEVCLRAAQTYKKVTVIAEWGNHGRLGSKRDAVPRSDNADRMTYELARRILASSNNDRIVWADCPEDIQRIEIGNYRALLIHGDEIGRHGYASPGTIVNHANRWRSGAYPWKFRDVYVGHYHTHAQYSLADGAGAVFMTGSTESDNRYANIGLAANAVPSQRLHFVDPDAGRVTSQYQVWLDA